MKAKLIKSSLLAAVALLGWASTAQAQVLVEDFEFASDTAAAQAGVTVIPSTTISATVDSGAGADASQGTYSLAVDITQAAEGAFDDVKIERWFAAPFTPTETITEANVGSFAVTLDIKGDAGLAGANIFLIAFDDDGQQWRFINFNEPALGNAAYSNDVRLNFFDIQSENSGEMGTINAVQVAIQNPNTATINGTLHLDNLVFTEAGDPIVSALLDDFEWATDNGAAAAGSTVSADVGSTIVAISGSGADATEGDHSVGLDLNFADVAYHAALFTRTLPTPIAVSGSYSVGGAPGSNVSELRLRLDVKGDPAFDSANDTSIWIRLYDDLGNTWRFINFSDAALNSDTFTLDHAVGFYDREIAGSADTFSAITGYQIVIQNPDAVTKEGVIYLDNFRIEEPSGEGLPTGLQYTIPLISPANAPNVTDTTFDAIYSNGGEHPVIEGNDWKDYASRVDDPGTPISVNGNNGTAIADTTKAYILSDDEYLYFGILVYDPDTSAMTADTGNNTYTKWSVEGIEFAISAQSGTDGPGDAVKFAMDAFGNIDDMFPDSSAGVLIDSSAIENSNSYIIDSTTWAMEFRVGIDELVSLSEAHLATPLPGGANATWYAHIGYQAPGGRVPLYAAGHANGFGNFTVELDLSEINVVTATEDWFLYR